MLPQESIVKRDEPLKVVLVSLDGPPIEDRMIKTLAEHGVDLVINECDSPEEVVSVAKDAGVIWVASGSRVVTVEVLNRLDRCGAILRSGSGTDNIPIDEATRLGIVVANTPESHAHAVAEHAIGLLLAVVRQIAAQDRAVRQGTWDRDHAYPAWHIVGQTLGLIGFGRIAQLVARKLSGMEMRIVATDPVIDAATMARYGAASVSLDELLKSSDFISIHTPLTDGTYHLIGERELKMCQRKAVLINTSRGSVIDEPALTRALSQGEIAAAGLDVFEQEPTPSDNPLLTFDNVVITPHIAGYSDQCWHLLRAHSIETLIELSGNRWPPWCVNPQVTPRWSLQRG